MMKKIFNKKTAGIGVLAAILLIGMIAPSLPIATAIHQPNHNPGGGGGGGGGGQAYIYDCEGTFNTSAELDIPEGTTEVRVKDGQTCNIYAEDNIEIPGDIKVGQGSTLQIGTMPTALTGGVVKTLTINGDIISDGGDYIRIEGVDGNSIEITGSVQIKNTANGVTVNFANIGGNSQFFNNENSYSITRSTIDGNVQVKDNSIPNDAGMYHNLSGNIILGNLQCSGNDPAPEAVFHGLNTVTGKAQGQCSGLEFP